MTNKVSMWSPVQLGKVLTYSGQTVALNDETEYTTITVKRRHGGLEAREKLFGSQIQTPACITWHNATMHKEKYWK